MAQGNKARSPASAPSSPGPRPALISKSSFGTDEELAGELPPTWSLARFQEEVKSMIKEYFVARVVDDAVARARELLKDCPAEADELGALAIRMALDRDQAAQQALVDLFCGLRRSSVLDASAPVRSFEKLFCTWEDIAIDAPKAPEALLGMLMGCFAGGVVEHALLTKIPEGLMNAGLARAGPSLQPSDDLLRTVAAELKEFKHQVSCCLEQYFVSLNLDEAEHRLREIGMANYHHELVKKAIIATFSQPSPQDGREAILVLFQKLTVSGVLSKDDLQWGVTRLLGQLDDLELDCPRAGELAVEFLACLVADEFVSAPFLRRCRLLRMGGATGLRVLDAAQRRTPEYCKKHLGIAQFKQELHTMIIEFFNSGDEAEFGRCVRELAPLSEERSAELIRKIMTVAMERSGADCEQALRLLVWLCRHEEISAEALEAGFDDLYRRMPDLLLDVPDAQEMARAFVVEAQKAKVLRPGWPDPPEL